MIIQRTNCAQNQSFYAIKMPVRQNPKINRKVYKFVRETGIDFKTMKDGKQSYRYIMTRYGSQLENVLLKKLHALNPEITQVRAKQIRGKVTHFIQQIGGLKTLSMSPEELDKIV